MATTIQITMSPVNRRRMVTGVESVRQCCIHSTGRCSANGIRKRLLGIVSADFIVCCYDERQHDGYDAEHNHAEDASDNNVFHQ
ncbi:hypothetical protein LU456_004708 [Escherichia coli]|nr:hypothetical protein [Escherichia coli]